MYFMNDKARAVRAIQRMLGVPESGRLDRRTLDKAETVTGKATNEIGYGEFLMIKEAHRARKRSAAVAERLGSWSVKRGPGEYTRGQMTEINMLLAEAMRKNRLEGYPPRGGFYTKDSERAVALIRRMLLLPEGGIDTELLYGIIMNLRAYESKNNYSS